MATVKKAQKGVTATPDSTSYYKSRMDEDFESAARNMNSPKYSDQAFKRAEKNLDNYLRQSNKGKPGYDKNGFPIKKGKAGIKVKKAQAGGVTKANPKAPMVDPKGAFTTVQKRTIAGAKVAKKGMSIKKGMHKMPNGSMMKNSAMKSKSKKK
jgi:hypothetical protein